MDFRNEIETVVDGDSIRSFKANLVKLYSDMYVEVKGCPLPSKLHDDVQWCVYEKLFRAVERKKKLVDGTFSSSNGSPEIGGVKRLLDEMSIMDWMIPEPVEDSLVIGDDKLNFNKVFFQYQKDCLSKFQIEQFYNWRTDIQKLLSLSSIVFLDGVRGVCDYLENDTYQSLYHLMSSEFRETTEMSRKTLGCLQDIIWEYQKDFDHCGHNAKSSRSL
ncbi:uncharacterized protein B0P05DRAFT_589982 [Gilbertella persicaria]|uniref:uncharacterized protein n=1 Tax=Gilbertella persicaria TaxID=101096 RepID=UPI00221E6D0A|nr:uncharacterized protein B0P05DRAFT_589982 [Gilbertella persicaria]KAI8065409.1 hypothetical protein B0P05DRAFT_589982 [Gilbertella persicaria]